MTKKKTETVVMSYESTSDKISDIKKKIDPVEEPAPVKKTGSTRKKKIDPVEESKPNKKTGNNRKKKSEPAEEAAPHKTGESRLKKRITGDILGSTETENKLEESEEPISPSDYFHKIKGMMSENSPENVRTLLQNSLTLMKKPMITGQTKMADDIYTVTQVLLKELKVVEAGFTTYVKRDDLIYYIDKVANKVAKLIDIKNYEREIPDDVFEKLIAAKEIFDDFIIVFTDYTGESERQIEKKKRDKDPILFGVFKMSQPGKSTIYFSRLYFIGDWVDEYCDLTLDKMIEEYKSKTGKDITNTIHSDMSVDDIRNAIESIKNPKKSQLLPTEVMDDEY